MEFRPLRIDCIADGQELAMARLGVRKSMACLERIENQAHHHSIVDSLLVGDFDCIVDIIAKVAAANWTMVIATAANLLG